MEQESLEPEHRVAEDGSHVQTMGFNSGLPPISLKAAWRRPTEVSMLPKA
jgi:hypothetical protein